MSVNAADLGLELYRGERVWFTRPPNVAGIEVLHARHSPRLWQIWHEDYKLCLIYDVSGGAADGAVSWKYRGREFSAGPGAVMLFEPGDSHRTTRVVAGGQLNGCGSFDVLILSRDLVHELANECGVATPVHLSLGWTAHPRLCAALEALARAIYLQDDSLTLQCRIVDAVTVMLQSCAERPLCEPPVLSNVQIRRVREFITNHYSADFDLDALANVAGASKSSVAHELTRGLGVSPMKLRTLIRTAHAKTMLASGKDASHVAQQTGFYDQPKLTNWFHKLWGVPPDRYRRMVESGWMSRELLQSGPYAARSSPR